MEEAIQVKSIESEELKPALSQEIDLVENIEVVRQSEVASRPSSPLQRIEIVNVVIEKPLEFNDSIDSKVTKKNKKLVNRGRRKI